MGHGEEPYHSEMRVRARTHTHAVKPEVSSLCTHP